MISPRLVQSGTSYGIKYTRWLEGNNHLKWISRIQYTSGICSFPIIYTGHILDDYRHRKYLMTHIGASFSALVLSSCIGFISPIFIIPLVGLSPIWIPSYLIFSSS